jgi:hypothetical protein
LLYCSTYDIIERLQEAHAQVKPFTYVDDIIVENVDDTPEKVVDKQQEACHMLCQWTRDNKQSIQGEKSQWIMITRVHINRENFSLTFDGEPVPHVEVIICLGVAIDKLITMAKHLDRLREKGAKGLTTLRYAAGQKVTQRSLIALMRATVQSKLQYGLHLASATAVTAQRKLEQVQNESMRIVTGAAKPTS